MNKTYYLLLSGFFMLVAGIMMLLSEKVGVYSAKVLVPLCFFIGGISAYMFSRANKQHKIASQFHLLQGVGMIIFAIAIATMADGLEGFLKLVTYFLMVYGLFEIMFSFSVLRTKFKINKSILVTRLLVGVVNLIGAFALLLTLLKDAKSGLILAGVLLILGGFGFILFARRLKS